MGSQTEFFFELTNIQEESQETGDQPQKKLWQHTALLFPHHQSPLPPLILPSSRSTFCSCILKPWASKEARLLPGPRGYMFIGLSQSS